MPGVQRYFGDTSDGSAVYQSWLDGMADRVASAFAAMKVLPSTSLYLANQPALGSGLRLACLLARMLAWCLAEPIGGCICVLIANPGTCMGHIKLRTSHADPDSRLPDSAIPACVPSKVSAAADTSRDSC